MPLLGEHPHDALDVGQEAQVQHLVGLVQDEGLDAAEHQVALLGEVQQAARGADHHVDALAQGGELRLVGTAAVDRGDADAELRAGVGEVLRDLDAQLTGRHDDECLGHVLGAVGGLAVGVRGWLFRRWRDPLEQRDAETERLAHAGAGLADDVFTGERERERQLLDGERALDAGLGQRGDDLGTDTELGERGGVGPYGGPGLQGMRLFGAIGGGVLGDCVGLDGQGDRLSPRTGADSARRPPTTSNWRESRRGAVRTRSVEVPGSFPGALAVGAHPVRALRSATS